MYNSDIDTPFLPCDGCSHHAKNSMVIEVVFDDLRPFVGGIQQTYAQHYYFRHGGGGVFWKGRFKSKPVEIGGYLVSVGRYVERNPVRAGIVTEPWSYKWTSAAHYVHESAVLSLLVD